MNGLRSYGTFHSENTGSAPTKSFGAKEHTSANFQRISSFYSLFIAFIEVISAYNYCYHVYLYLLIDHLYDCSIKK